MSSCRRDDQVPLERGDPTWQHDQAAVRRVDKVGDGAPDLVGIAHGERRDCNAG